MRPPCRLRVPRATQEFRRETRAITRGPDQGARRAAREGRPPSPWTTAAATYWAGPTARSPPLWPRKRPICSAGRWPSPVPRYRSAQDRKQATLTKRQVPRDWPKLDVFTSAGTSSSTGGSRATTIANLESEEGADRAAVARARGRLKESDRDSWEEAVGASDERRRGPSTSATRRRRRQGRQMPAEPWSKPKSWISPGSTWTRCPTCSAPAPRTRARRRPRPATGIAYIRSDSLSQRVRASRARGPGEGPATGRREMADFRRPLRAETRRARQLGRSPTATASCTTGSSATTCPASRRQFKENLNTNTMREVAASGPSSPSRPSNQGAGRHDQRIRWPASTTTPAGISGWTPPRRTPRSGFREDLRACTDDALSGEVSDHTPRTSSCRSPAHRAVQGPRRHADADRPGRGGSPTCGTGSSSPRPNASARTTPSRDYTDSAASPAGRRRSWPTRSWPRRWPTSSSWMGRGRVADVPVRRHRRGVRAWIRRVHPVRAQAVRAARAATADRHPAAEDPCDRAVRLCRRLRRQPERATTRDCRA